MTKPPRPRTHVLVPASGSDVPELAALRTAVAEKLTREFGRGHWSAPVTPQAQRAALNKGTVFVMRAQRRIVATLRLVAKRPPESHRLHFTPCPRPIYLYDMAVAPARQREGLGRAALAEVVRIGRAWRAGGVRLDAYDAPAGAGPFYEKCGFRVASRRIYFRAPIIYYERLL